MSEKPLVSVVIPTYNSGDTLEICLDSIRKQTYSTIEILVIDNNSSDKTQEIAKNHNVKLCVLEAERSEARNKGIQESRGEYLLSIDSDMELSPHVVKECVSVMEGDANVGGVIIPERSVGDSFWVHVRDFERRFYAGTPVESARFFRTELAWEAGGYDESVVFFEESTLPQKIAKMGYDVSYRIDAPIFHHEDNFSLHHWLKKKYYYGKTAGKYLEERGGYANKQVSPLERYNVFIKDLRRLLKKPLLASGIFLLKTLEYISAGIGYFMGEVGK